MSSALSERAADKRALLDALAAEALGEDWSETSPFDDALAAAVHAYVARAESRIVLVQLDDLAGERVGVNLPGTDRERPNWRRRLGPDLEDLAASPRLRAILDAVRRERARAG
jgi:glycogen operon protein